MALPFTKFVNIFTIALRSPHLAIAHLAGSGAHGIIDPTLFLSTIVATSAALVAIIGGLLVAKFVGMDSDQRANRKILADAAERLKVAQGRAGSARQSLLRWQAGAFFRTREVVKAVVDNGLTSADELVKISNWPHRPDELAPFAAEVAEEAKRAQNALNGRIRNPDLFWPNFYHNTPGLPEIRWSRVWEHVYGKIARDVAAAQEAKRQAERRDRPFADITGSLATRLSLESVRIPLPGIDDRETAARRYDDLRADDARAQQQVDDLEAELHRLGLEHAAIVRPDGRLWWGVGILVVFTVLGVVLPLGVMATGPRDLASVRWIIYPFIFSLLALIGYIVVYLAQLTRNKP